MDKLELYVIVYEVLDGEAEWTFIPATDMDDRIASIHAMQHYKDCAGFTDDDEEISIHDTLGSVWYEKVYVDGYDIKLIEKDSTE